MKEKVAIRCIIGAPIGLALSTIITIAISLTVGMDAFTRLFPNELQTAGRKLMQFCCRQSVHYYMVRHGAEAGALYQIPSYRCVFIEQRYAA